MFKRVKQNKITHFLYLYVELYSKGLKLIFLSYNHKDTVQQSVQYLAAHLGCPTLASAVGV